MSNFKIYNDNAMNNLLVNELNSSNISTNFAETNNLSINSFLIQSPILYTITDAGFIPPFQNPINNSVFLLQNISNSDATITLPNGTFSGQIVSFINIDDIGVQFEIEINTFDKTHGTSISKTIMMDTNQFGAVLTIMWISAQDNIAGTGGGWVIIFRGSSDTQINALSGLPDIS